MKGQTKCLLLDLADLLDRYDVALGSSSKGDGDSFLYIQHLFPLVENVDLTRCHVTAYELRQLARG